MKRILCGLALALSMPLSLAAGGFEGEIKGYVGGSKGEGLPMTVLSKGSKTWTDMMGMVFLSDKEKKMTYWMFPIHNQYAEIKEEDERKEEVSLSKYSLKMTAKFKTINGHKCQLWEVTEEGKEWAAECWLTTGLQVPGNFSFSSLKGGDRQKGWLSLFDGKPGLPVRIALRESAEDASARILMDFEKIESKKLDDAIFLLPEGYRKVGMFKAAISSISEIKAAKRAARAELLKDEPSATLPPPDPVDEGRDGAGPKS